MKTVDDQSGADAETGSLDLAVPPTPEEGLRLVSALRRIEGAEDRPTLLAMVGRLATGPCRSDVSISA